MSTIHTALAFLHSTLSNALSIPVRELGAARDVSPPYCVYEVAPQNDRRTKTALVWSPVEATVRIVGRGSPKPLEEHVEAAEQALQSASAPEIEDCTRTAPFRLPVYRLEGDEQPMQEIGAVFRIRVRESA